MHGLRGQGGRVSEPGFNVGRVSVQDLSTEEGMDIVAVTVAKALLTYTLWPVNEHQPKRTH